MGAQVYETHAGIVNPIPSDGKASGLLIGDYMNDHLAFI